MSEKEKLEKPNVKPSSQVSKGNVDLSKLQIAFAKQEVEMIASYLSRCPWREVAPIMNMIESKLASINIENLIQKEDSL